MIQLVANGRRVLAVGLVALAALVTSVARADAATNPYTPTEACGSSYYTLNSMPVKTNSGQIWGRVYLMYSGSTRKNCVVTIKTSFVGTPTKTTAWIEARNGAVGYDEGDFKYYARDYVYAPGYCVWYGGYIYNSTETTYAYASSDWGWCD